MINSSQPENLLLTTRYRYNVKIKNIFHIPPPSVLIFAMKMPYFMCSHVCGLSERFSVYENKGEFPKMNFFAILLYFCIIKHSFSIENVQKLFRHCFVRHKIEIKKKIPR